MITKFRCSILTAALLLSPLVFAQTEADPFSFVAIGDMPYGNAKTAYPLYRALIGVINGFAPDFTIHIGDIKSGSTECSDEEFANQKAFFNTFASALVYTPGDNEWTDCHREDAGSYDPLERLAKMREMFYPSALTLGKQPFKLERQAELMPQYKTYVENSRFVKNGLLFVQVHMVGSNNNFETRDMAAIREFIARDAANIAWLEDSFKAAQARKVKGVVVSMQADIFDSAAYYGDFPRHSGFAESVGNTLLPAAQAFGKPVLIIHGDSHIFRIDRPFTDEEGEVIQNVMRLEVFGEDDIDGVRVMVNPNAPNGSMFAFQPIWGASWVK